MKRELAAAVAIPVVLAVLFFAPPAVFNVLVGGVGLAALWEFYRIAEKTGLPVAKTVGIAGGAAALSLPVLPNPPSPAAIGIALLVLTGLAAVAPLAARVDLHSALGGAAGTVFGVLSVALPATAVGFLRLHSPRAVLFLFLIVWGCDSFAYYTGKNFGRRKLAPRVSPNKTWEGTLGGLAG
ncbi:MAG TPA: phosphatidate cytidylyltransferase, partial [Thermoanaerobaculia bacterium]|nr:phosphatidate cytidylyltransferase [Thermoanaerobaculia bacterium]